MGGVGGAWALEAVVVQRSVPHCWAWGAGEVWAEECPFIGRWCWPIGQRWGLRPGGAVAPRCPQGKKDVEGRPDTSLSKVAVKIVTRVVPRFRGPEIPA